MPADDFDPTAAPFQDDPTAAPGSGEDPLDPDDPSPLVRDDGTFNLDRGFVDTAGIIRVWTDDQGVVTKVRVAPSWRDRVGRTTTDEQRADSLARSFGNAFTVINVAFRSTAEPAPWTDDVPAGATVLSTQSLADLTERMADVQARIDAIPDEERIGAMASSPASARAASGAVTVSLNDTGGYSTIRFDSDWLAESRIGQVCDGVTEACRKAKESFQPGHREPSEYDILTQQSRDLRNELTAMMKRGFF